MKQDKLDQEFLNEYRALVKKYYPEASELEIHIKAPHYSFKAKGDKI